MPEATTIIPKMIQHVTQFYDKQSTPLDNSDYVCKALFDNLRAECSILNHEEKHENEQLALLQNELEQEETALNVLEEEKKDLEKTISNYDKRWPSTEYGQARAKLDRSEGILIAKKTHIAALKKQILEHFGVCVADNLKQSVNLNLNLLQDNQLEYTHQNKKVTYLLLLYEALSLYHYDLTDQYFPALNDQQALLKILANTLSQHCLTEALNEHWVLDIYQVSKSFEIELVQDILVSALKQKAIAYAKAHIIEEKVMQQEIILAPIECLSRYATILNQYFGINIRKLITIEMMVVYFNNVRCYVAQIDNFDYSDVRFLIRPLITMGIDRSAVCREMAKILVDLIFKNIQNLESINVSQWLKLAGKDLRTVFARMLKNQFKIALDKRCALIYFDIEEHYESGSIIEAGVMIEQLSQDIKHFECIEEILGRQFEIPDKYRNIIQEVITEYILTFIKFNQYNLVIKFTRACIPILNRLSPDTMKRVMREMHEQLYPAPKPTCLTGGMYERFVDKCKSYIKPFLYPPLDKQFKQKKQFYSELKKTGSDINITAEDVMPLINALDNNLQDWANGVDNWYVFPRFGASTVIGLLLLISIVVQGSKTDRGDDTSIVDAIENLDISIMPAYMLWGAFLGVLSIIPYTNYCMNNNNMPSSEVRKYLLTSSEKSPGQKEGASDNELKHELPRPRARHGRI